MSNLEASGDNTSLANSNNIIDLTDDGGITKEILRKGSGELAKPGYKVAVNYVGRLEDGTIFDSSQNKGKPFTVTLGSDDDDFAYIWQLAIATMQVGELSRFTCSPDYGYGEEGLATFGIPPNAKLIFEVEMLSQEVDQMSRLPIQERLARGNALKEEGNALYRKAEYEAALEKYKAAFDHYTYVWGLSETQKRHLREAKLPCLLNLSQCYLKLGRHRECIDKCTEVILELVVDYCALIHLLIQWMCVCVRVFLMLLHRLWSLIKAM
eukprot:GEZU01005702.1.p1 GENE.GEZU01005702.1~~GEZU01005702.1.p1  ORF type:complete len:267 (-),score=17.40 GEZU01005702.1:274-1074(-)